MLASNPTLAPPVATRRTTVTLHGGTPHSSVSLKRLIPWAAGAHPGENPEEWTPVNLVNGA
jgi:hypothetical protein